MAKTWCGPDDECLAELLMLLEATVQATAEYTTEGNVGLDAYGELMCAMEKLIESWDRAAENTARYLEDSIDDNG